MTETAGCDCPPRRAYGFTLIQHRDDCLHAPVDVCTGCGHDMFASEDDAHELCAAA